MSNLIFSLDIEDVLQKDINAVAQRNGISLKACAPPIPTDLGASLPLVVIERLGGTREDIVVEEHRVAVDIWENDWASAQDAARKVVGIIAGLPYIDGLTEDYYDASIEALPYNNPDPDHPTVPRVSLVAVITARADEI